MPKTNAPKNIRCSFCGLPQDNVRKIIAGPGVYICDECIGICKTIIEEDYYEDDEGTYNIGEAEELPNPAQARQQRPISCPEEQAQHRGLLRLHH